MSRNDACSSLRLKRTNGSGDVYRVLRKSSSSKPQKVVTDAQSHVLRNDATDVDAESAFEHTERIRSVPACSQAREVQRPLESLAMSRRIMRRHKQKHNIWQSGEPT